MRPLQSIVPILVLVVAAGCDEVRQPVPEGVDQGVDPGWHVQTHAVPPPAQLDFLFIVDDGPSMCEEQDNLTRNFAAFANHLFEELGAAARYRIAVVGTGLDGPAAGAFAAEPTPPVPDENCVDDEGNRNVPNTADCEALVAEGPAPIIASGSTGNIGRGCDQADPTARAQCARGDLERRFRCLATRGTGRAGPSQGLEAMRRALDCNGPNAEHLAPCCVDGPDGGRVYDPACAVGPDEAPAFLHPDGVLTVVFVSDSDDCSSAAALGPDPEACAADADRLTPVDDYRRFLQSLKRSPAEQLRIMSVVGLRDFTPAGQVVRWSETPPQAGCAAGEISDACCPAGQCAGPLAPSCASESGEAFTGHRYLALTEAFGENGIGCPQPPAGLPDDAQRIVACLGGDLHDGCVFENDDGRVVDGLCQPAADDGRLACGACTTVCEDDFIGPLGDTAVHLFPSYCLDVPPTCQLPAGDGALRPCETAAERASPSNYPIRVEVTCPAENGDDCGALEPWVLDRSAWSLRLDQPACASGALVLLDAPPPPGTQVTISIPR